MEKAKKWCAFWILLSDESRQSRIFVFSETLFFPKYLEMHKKYCDVYDQGMIYLFLYFSLNPI